MNEPPECPTMLDHEWANYVLTSNPVQMDCVKCGWRYLMSNPPRRMDHHPNVIGSES